MSLNFVNIHGQRVSTVGTPVKRPRSTGPEEFHKGFRVVGIPPGAWEEAKAKRESDIQFAKRQNAKPPEELTYEVFANGFKGKPVRSKPYELREAADQCRGLAVKAGWDRVFVVEIKREKQAA